MSYPGNSSLGDEVRQRILSTFSQSLDLVETGRQQEAALGCDFILELDPQFEPARTLKERLESGQEGGVEDLRAQLRGESRGEAPGESPGGSEARSEDQAPAASPPAGEANPDDLFDLDDFDLPDLDDADTPSAGDSPVSAGAGEGLRARLERLVETRNLQAAMDLANEHRDEVTADPALNELVQNARSRLEAQPYVEKFLEDAGAALRSGDAERARPLLERARSLDPDHPLIADLSESLDGEPATPAAPAAPGGPEAPSEQALGGPSLDDAAGILDEPTDEPAAGAGLDLEQPASGGSAHQVQPPEDFEPPSARRERAGEAEAPAPAPESEEPAAPAAPAPGGEPAEEDDRIAQLLGEGQEAADRGDYQTAIDAWSRIFLIDVDHEEAAQRIEKVRRLKAEREREVEEIFHDGLDALERGEKDSARERFEKALEIHPGHLAAREYLQQIESGGPVTGPGPSPDDAAGVEDIGSFDLADLSGAESEESSEPLKQEILVPPDPDAAPAERPAQTADSSGSAEEGTAAPRRVAAGARSGRRSFLFIGGAVLVLVLAAAWFLLQNKERFFPNSSADEAATAQQGPQGAQGRGPSVIDRARSLHQSGRTAMALGQLRRIRPDQPEYEEAQELIVEWEAATEPAVPQAPEPSVPAEELERRGELLAQADRAFERSEFLRALELYDDARDIRALEGETQERFREAARELEPIKRQIELFRQGEYEMVMPELWRILEEDPTNRDVRRLLVDSYYNRGVRELQRGDAARAAAEFQEALSLAPDDEELRRHYLFAQTYQQRAKDLLYRIYVKYLPFR